MRFSPTWSRPRSSGGMGRSIGSRSHGSTRVPASPPFSVIGGTDGGCWRPEVNQVDSSVATATARWFSRPSTRTMRARSRSSTACRPRQAPRGDSSGRGSPRSCRDADGAHHPVRLRLHRAVGAQNGRRARRHRRAGCPATPDAGRGHGPRHDVGRGVQRRRGRRRAVQTHVASGPHPVRAERRPAPHRRNRRTLVASRGRRSARTTRSGPTRCGRR